MRPRRAALLTPPSATPAFLQNVAKSCICHTSENSPVTPIIATDPKTRSRKSCVCHTCDPLPPPPFHFSSSFSRHESLATSKFPRSWLQICPFIFKQLQDAPPATLFFSCFCMVARGVAGGKPGSLLPQCSLSRIPAQSRHLRSPHLRFPASQSWIGTAQPRAGTLVFPTSHQSRITSHRSCVGDSLATRHFPRNFSRMRSYKKSGGRGGTPEKQFHWAAWCRLEELRISWRKMVGILSNSADL